MEHPSFEALICSQVKVYPLQIALKSLQLDSRHSSVQLVPQCPMMTEGSCCFCSLRCGANAAEALKLDRSSTSDLWAAVVESVWLFVETLWNANTSD